MSSANTTAALITRTKSGTDPYGNDVVTETFTVLQGVFWPAGSSESRQGGDQVRWHDTLCLPDGTDVSAIDAAIPQVVVDASGNPVLDGNGNPQGDRFEVTGQPTVWPAHPRTRWRPAFPVVLELDRVTG